MNGQQPRIEIFEPFGAALEMMKRTLFQPFDFAKWLVIGFAAFLSGFWGGSFHVPFPTGGNWNFRTHSYKDFSISDSLPGWLVPFFIVVAVIVVLVVTVVLMWLSSRGRFIFTDCVVKNRAAIVAPWKEYRREGNSFFLFALAVMLLAMVIAGVVAVLVLLPLGLFSHKSTPDLRLIGVLGMIFVVLVWICGAVFFAVVTHFMIPVMYRRRCLAREAFLDVSRLLLAHPGPIIVYVLFGIVLLMALVVVSSIVSCLTCCIAGLPYVSSVVLLPAFVWLLSFKLLFLRQFGSAYDVWAPVESLSAALPDPPPTQPE